MTNLVILHSNSGSAVDHMRRDAMLLDALSRETTPRVHHYDWTGECVTHGYFIQPESLLNMDRVMARGVQLARRPTGGGLLFHVTDLAFSFLVPASHPLCSANTLQNYAWINRAVARALQKFLGQSGECDLLQDGASRGALDAFCMAHPTHYDLLLNGKKVGGAAQRRTRHGLLHQGSLYLAPTPRPLLEELLRDGQSIADAMQRSSHPLLSSSPSSHELSDARRDLRILLNEALAAAIS